VAVVQVIILDQLLQPLEQQEEVAVVELEVQQDQILLLQELQAQLTLVAVVAVEVSIL
jgi:hypothetical protein